MWARILLVPFWLGAIAITGWAATLWAHVPLPWYGDLGVVSLLLLMWTLIVAVSDDVRQISDTIWEVT